MEKDGNDRRSVRPGCTATASPGASDSSYERLFKEIRHFELELIARALPYSGRILELGGGDGFQASILGQRGYEVVALDVPSRPAVEHEHHPIQIFDGRQIPYPESCFDAVFSSNVLEHVADLDQLLTETRRVLRPDGVAVHAMPTPSWRLWTSITFALGFVSRARAAVRRRSLVRPERTKQSRAGAQVNRPRRLRGQVWPLLRRVGQLARENVVAPRHGVEGHGALSELLLFRERRWKSTLEGSGFRVFRTAGMGLFYTGDLLLEKLSLRRRRQLSRILGPSCRLYCARPR